MSACLKKHFLEEPRLRSTRFRYGFLAFVIGLIILQVILAIQMKPSDRLGRFFGFVVPFMLLFNHLAFQFRWSSAVTAFWRVVAWVWMIFGLPYILFVTFKR